MAPAVIHRKKCSISECEPLLCHRSYRLRTRALCLLCKPDHRRAYGWATFISQAPYLHQITFSVVLHWNSTPEVNPKTHTILDVPCAKLPAFRHMDTQQVRPVLERCNGALCRHKLTAVFGHARGLFSWCNFESCVKMASSRNAKLICLDFCSNAPGNGWVLHSNSGV